MVLARAPSTWLLVGWLTGGGAAGCAQPDPGVSVELEVVGHLGAARDDGGAVRWIVPGEGPFEVRVSPDVGEGGFRLRRASGEATGLEVIAVHRGRARLRSETPLEVGATAELVHAGASLKLSFAAPPDAWARIRQAARAEGGEARIALEAVVADPVHPLEALTALHQLAKRAPSPDGYIALQVERAERAAGLGYPSAAVHGYVAAAYAEHRRLEFDRARALLERAESALGDVPDAQARARIALLRAYVDATTARYRTATAAVERGIVAAERFGDRLLLTFLRKQRAIILSAVGRHEAALELLESLRGEFEGLPDSLRLPYLVDAAYVAATANAEAATKADWDRVIGITREALTLAQRLEDADQIANIRVNLASAYARAGRVQRAREELERLRDGGAGGFAADVARLLEAKLSLRSRPREALARFERLREGGAGRPEVVWRAEHGRGLSLAALGRHRAAREAFSAAFEGLERVSMHTDLRRERGRFFDARGEVYGEAVGAMVDAGHLDAGFVFDAWGRSALLRAFELRARLERLDRSARDAWEAARTAYARARASLAERPLAREALARSQLAEFDAETRRVEARAEAAWRRAFGVLDAAGAVPPPALRGIEPLTSALGDDAVLVAFTRIGGRRFGFRVRSGEVIGGGLPEARARLTRIGEARHVYLVPGGDHPLELLVDQWMPELLEQATVSFLPSADLLVRPTSGASGPPLVVGDPGWDLPGARAEASWVADRLGVVPLLGASVTRAAVDAGLAGTSLFHFSGHGQLAPDDPYRAHIDLGPGGRLRLEDLLASPSGPAVAVLSGCETGRRGRVGGRYAMGLPDALLLAGSRAVVASTRVLDDAAAARFVRAFYAAGGAERPISAFRSAYAASPEKDRAGFFIGGRRR